MWRKALIILKDSEGPIQLILIGTGSELFLALEASELLNKEGIAARVVSMPSWELFEKQPEEYKKSIFPKEITKRLSIEALSPFGWDKYVGSEGKIIGINRFGESGPGEEVMKLFGFTSQNIVAEAKKLIGIV
jgi:transketolase